MLPYLSRAFRHVKRKASWALPLEIFAFVFVTGWLLMAWAEPAGARITDGDAYWWWFATTVTPASSGQQDFHPSTPLGQLVGVYVIVGGIVTITTLFTSIAATITKARGIRMQGRGELKLSGHIILLGYSAGRTERLVDRLVADEPRELVICDWPDRLQQHPLPDREDVHFIRGDLTDDEVLRRAAVPAARSVLVDARDDNEALKVTVAVSHANPDVHIVVSLREMDHAQTIARIAGNASCIQWYAVDVLSEELHDPGMSQVYGELMRHSDRNTYSVTVPDSLPGRTFGEYQQALGRWNAATVLAIRRGTDLQVSPSWYEEVPAGTVLYYVGRRRLLPHDLERFIDRSEQILVSTEDDLRRGTWF
ncbi:NAD-binding protein [Haloechinothrix sp. YIM 98757]|uniref:NAD-binding protein n=1 Tax=Haloechinothrix aidingensis TaxID=2752311 RepID=A0A838A7E8_9PSEU|nr:NAD-binding protein [Haloechinothrix aidingensis]